MSRKQNINLLDIDYSYVDINFPSLDILHNRVSSGLYHCVGIKQMPRQKLFDDDKIEYKNITYTSYELYGWGSNNKFVLGTNQQLMRSQMSSLLNENKQNQMLNSSEDSIKEVKQMSLVPAKQPKENFQDQESDDESNDINAQEMNSMYQEKLLFIEFQIKKKIKYLPLSVSCGVYHTAILAVPEEDLIDINRKIMSTQELDDRKLNYMWKEFYQKTAVFTSGIVDNKRLGYFVCCKYCKGKNELVKGKESLQGYMCDICRIRQPPESLCLRCDCNNCNYDVCPACFEENQVIQCEVCKKKSFIEIIDPYETLPQQIPKCQVCESLVCQCNTCKTKHTDFSHTKFCRNPDCQLKMREIIQQYDNSQTASSFLCSQECGSNVNNYYYCYSSEEDKQKLCQYCQSKIENLIDIYREKNYYVERKKYENSCDYFNPEYKYYCDRCDKRFQKETKIGECLTCKQYFVCYTCILEGAKCGNNYCKSVSKVTPHRVTTPGGYLIIKEGSKEKTCGLEISESKNFNTLYMLCNCSKFGYKLCLQSCYNEAWEDMFYRNQMPFIRSSDDYSQKYYNKNKLNDIRKGDFNQMGEEDLEEEEEEEDDNEEQENLLIKDGDRYHNGDEVEEDFSYFSEDFADSSSEGNEDFLEFQKCVPLQLRLPEHKKFIQGIIQLSCGDAYSLILTTEGRVYAWGDGSSGALGCGHNQDEAIPQLVRFDADIKIQFISAGSTHACAISTSEKLYGWGGGSSGQIGIGYVQNSVNIPQAIAGELTEKSIAHVSCGGSHTVAVTLDGYTFSWGLNGNGQLGLGDYRNRYEPTRITHLDNYFTVQVSCGINDTFILTENGQEFAFGNNNNNKLGIHDNALKDKKNFFNPHRLQDEIYQNRKIQTQPHISNSYPEDTQPMPCWILEYYYRGD